MRLIAAAAENATAAKRAARTAVMSLAVAAAALAVAAGVSLGGAQQPAAHTSAAVDTGVVALDVTWGH
ncbi:hypothetical protein [Kitasatospora sp. LaBMicrA B282]|uniref:hypothetical protein n=1 Tax=Kitasatospora sp. LaBMicrA B282 TaxID=3420949 RepID=UPI003D0B6CE2